MLRCFLVIHCVTILSLSRHLLRHYAESFASFSASLCCHSRNSLRYCAVSFASFFTSAVSFASFFTSAVSFASFFTSLCCVFRVILYVTVPCLSRHSLRYCVVFRVILYVTVLCLSRHFLRHCAVSFASYVTVLCLSRHSLCYCVVDCQTKAAQHGADDADAQAQEASDLAAANQAGIADLTSDVDDLNSDNGLQVSSCCCG